MHQRLGGDVIRINTTDMSQHITQSHFTHGLKTLTSQQSIGRSVGNGVEFDTMQQFNDS